MASLTKSLYLMFRKSRLAKEISFQEEFDRARNILVRLAEKPPYTLFSIYIAAALKNGEKDRKITALASPDVEPLLSTLKGVFADCIYTPETPSHGSKAFKALKEQLAGLPFDVFADLDPKPLSELAVLTAAKLRIACDSQKLFPYFNVVFNFSDDADLRSRAVNLTRFMVGKEDIEKQTPQPNLNMRSAERWLRKHGARNGKRKSYFLSSIVLPFDNINTKKVYQPDQWQSEEATVKTALLDSATAYIGTPGRDFELAYLVGTPSVIITTPQVFKPSVPSSPLVKIVSPGEGELSPETIETALTTLRL